MASVEDTIRILKELKGRRHEFSSVEDFQSALNKTDLHPTVISGLVTTCHRECSIISNFPGAIGFSVEKTLNPLIAEYEQLLEGMEED